MHRALTMRLPFQGYKYSQRTIAIISPIKRLKNSSLIGIFPLMISNIVIFLFNMSTIRIATITKYQKVAFTYEYSFQTVYTITTIT